MKYWFKLFDVLSCKFHKQTDNMIGIKQDPAFLGINTLRARQNGQLFPDYIYKWIFLKDNVLIVNIIWLYFVRKGPIDNKTELVQIMAWHQTGAKPLSKPMMA